MTADDFHRCDRRRMSFGLIRWRLRVVDDGVGRGHHDERIRHRQWADAGTEDGDLGVGPIGALGPTVNAAEDSANLLLLPMNISPHRQRDRGSGCCGSGIREVTGQPEGSGSADTALGHGNDRPRLRGLPRSEPHDAPVFGTSQTLAIEAVNEVVDRGLGAISRSTPPNIAGYGRPGPPKAAIGATAATRNNQDRSQTAARPAPPWRCGPRAPQYRAT